MPAKRADSQSSDCERFPCAADQVCCSQRLKSSFEWKVRSKNREMSSMYIPLLMATSVIMINVINLCTLYSSSYTCIVLTATRLVSRDPPPPRVHHSLTRPRPKVKIHGR